MKGICFGLNILEAILAQAFGSSGQGLQFKGVQLAPIIRHAISSILYIPIMRGLSACHQHTIYGSCTCFRHGDG